MTFLGPADIRALADRLGVRPTKTLGQNFLHDANTIRRIVRTAELDASEAVLEVGPGLGSLTLGLLDAGHSVLAVEIDSVLAVALPKTVVERIPDAPLTVLNVDALRVDELPSEPTALVANLPYNVAVPVVPFRAFGPADAVCAGAPDAPCSDVSTNRSPDARSRS